MAGDLIAIRGARQNNLTGIDVDLPRGSLIAITGVSGSGKSSLAFDTLFREGQRRFLETLSAYARQFLGRMEKPQVESIDGLSPAIAVDQRAVQRGPRSTVGTLTEIYDFLRVLYARAGTAHCPEHGSPLVGQSAEAILEQVLSAFDGQAVHVLAPLVRDRKGEHGALLLDLKKRGFVRARVDGTLLRLEEVPALERYKRHSIEVVIDRLRVDAEGRSRLREALGSAIELGKGDLIVHSGAHEASYSTQRSCPVCGLEAPPMEPRLFSFNSPHGACERCDGLGVARAPGVGRIVRDAALSIRGGALAVTRAAGGGLLFPRVDFRFLEAVGEQHGFELETPWQELSAAAKRVVLHGTGAERFSDTASWKGAKYQGSVRWERRYQGVIPALEEAWKKGGRRKLVERFLETSACPVCSGVRLAAFARAVEVGGLHLGALVASSVTEARERLDALVLSPRQQTIATELLKEIRRRLDFLVQVGLGYLDLGRAADSLSGGEAQRIRLAAQLGTGLQGVLYVLDEPSVGLHERDNARLIGALQSLRDMGNTVVVVEHDESTLRAADVLVDIGPLAGRHGGRLLGAGAPSEIEKLDSPTGRMLRGELRMPAPAQRRKGSGQWLELTHVRGHNLRDLHARFPLGTFTVVSGPSGSGKSSLVLDTLMPAMLRHLEREGPDPLPFGKLLGAQAIEDLVCIDADPIGRTPRSNPATYTGVLGPVRELFTTLPEARMRGWGPGRFSFNVAGGRCESCQGAGAQLVELQFLAPVTVPCEACGGHRFQAETLEVRYKGRNIAEVLALTVEDAAAFFSELPKIAKPLDALVEVGLGYLCLGQPSTTLSGGEAQRVKLARELQKRSLRRTLYVLDEPTTGLHAFDVQKLVGALQRLVDQGHTVVAVEHNLDLLRAADHLLELGPDGGSGGGALLGTGTPEELEAGRIGATGEALAEQSAERRRRAKGTQIKPAKRQPASIPEQLRLQGVRTHNLRNIDVSLPRGKLSVITGPSGSGKSSLALDTIYAAGRQRFVESLSTYARQFLGSRDHPPVDRIEGLSPSVAVEARTSTGHPRSTVATTTEIHDHLRVLWARAGSRRCPEHGEVLEKLDASVLAKRLSSRFNAAKGWVLAPVVIDAEARKPEVEAAMLEGWRKQGFARLLVEGAEQRLDGLQSLPDKVVRLELVLDRLTFGSTSRARLAEAIEQAQLLFGGRFALRLASGEQHGFSAAGACTVCGYRLEEELEPRHFSFNTHVGACPDCDGLGEGWQCAAELLVDHPDLPLIPRDAGDDTAIGGKLGRYLTKGKGYYEYLLRTVARSQRIDLSRPFESLSVEQRELLLHGKGSKPTYHVVIEKHGETFDLKENFDASWLGLCGNVDAWHKKSEDAGWRAVLEGFMRREACRRCAGERLAPAPRAVVLGKLRLPQLLRLCVSDARAWLQGLELPEALEEATQSVIAELDSRLGLLERVGLGYLGLERSTATLSGGEARRVRLSAALGSRLVDVTYVLDEPTVGLHPADVERLTGALLELRDLGNTVIAVEHDENFMRRADWIVDMGPGAGRLGGQVMAAATPAELQRSGTSLTAQALRGEIVLERQLPASPNASAERVRLEGACSNNLKQAWIEARFGELTGICGPSGSGKSTLVLDTLVPALQGDKSRGRWKSLEGADGGGRRVVLVDASPLGRTPASVPATAVGLMESLRELYARLPEARARGLSASHFSFNSVKGRCPSCEGKGSTLVEMQFLADLWLSCEECNGRRYRPEVLEARYRGKSIADTMELSVDEALEIFGELPDAGRILRTLMDVGLAYLRLGQSSTTLSAGEAQRVKLAAELLGAFSGTRSVVVLDEPSTGLHTSDLAHLLRVLDRLAERGDAVVLIEHHTGLLAACDRLIELGPAGGAAGGQIIAHGTPQELRANPRSLTGPYLELRGSSSSPGRKPAKRPNHAQLEARA